MTKPKLGRPPKPAAEKQSALLQFKVTPAELALIDHAADGNRSGWLREMALRAAKRAAKR